MIEACQSKLRILYVCMPPIKCLPSWSHNQTYHHHIYSPQCLLLVCQVVTDVCLNLFLHPLLLLLQNSHHAVQVVISVLLSPTLLHVSLHFLLQFTHVALQASRCALIHLLLAVMLWLKALEYTDITSSGDQ